ncbi:nucleotidyltransferase family protein [Ruania zhangjianzhongii]|uniref:nucleotidyltransferase family protein n=1 Tax=Ruania zhangjianzhongii TaxID=2603206 RepID=UPI0011C98EED|nr:nucleotidyltransferase family protein [Ruania zhangjianzhongii]
MAIARGERPSITPALRADPAAFAGAARYHRLAPLAHVLLRDGEPDLAQAVQRDRDQARALHLHATTLLGHLGDLLDGVGWVVFKGPVLSELAHPVPGLRSYQDLDLLVRPEDLREVSVRLLGAGWTIADFEDMLRNPQLPGEMHWRSPTGVLMDLHWSMINMADRRRRLTVPTADLLHRREQVSLGFASAWTLDPVDGLLHVCLHAALTGANKLLYLVDAQRMAARITDWALVGERAADWRAAPHVALVLHRAQRSLGGELPEGLDRLLGSTAAFRALTAAVDRAAPVAAARTEPGVARLVARAVRPGAVRTTLASAQSVARRLSERPAQARTGRSPAGDGALDLYLDRVEATS